MRLDRFLANNTELSRKAVRQAVKAGRVRVRGEPATDVAMHIAEDASVDLDGEPVQVQGPGYYMMHKPAGMVCSHGDEHHPSVYDCFDRPASELHVAGRLDLDTTGLLLVTGDGKWSHRITSPNYLCPKRYRVRLAEFITQRMITQLERGVFLRPENMRTRPAKLEVLNQDEVLITITEGKYHQVKRMFETVENRVEDLHREAIGELELDPDLAPGEWRELSEREIALF